MQQKAGTRRRGCRGLVDRAVRYGTMRLQPIGGNRVTKLQQIGGKQVARLQ